MRLASVESVAVSQAVIFPPPGGPEIAAVLQRTNPDGLQQSVMLATASTTPGDNYFKIRLSSGAVANVKDPDPRPIKTAADLDRELRAAFPGVAMVPSAVFLQNAFGPFSYASGRGTAGETCLYAWQQIAASDDQKSAVTSRGDIQIRFRMCDAHRSEHDLLMVMYGFTITAAVNSKGWNPYGAAAFAQTTGPQGDGIVLPAGGATVCAQGAAPSTECIFAPSQLAARLAAASAGAPQATSPQPASLDVTPRSVPLPPARTFEQAIPSPLSPPLPQNKKAPAPDTRQAALGAVPDPSELASSQPVSPSAAPVAVVPSPRGLASPTLQAKDAGSAPSGSGTATSEVPPKPPRMIELSALPSSLRPHETTAGADCAPGDGKACPHESQAPIVASPFGVSALGEQ
ncbi:cellulose biosynthesis protein BcsN [Pleomorphomonas sp. PLEO]|uniref:cellulose biosynthesis protein BcsN n=1 Tax=Pleomorphomonas sp. PLEO TaxID=3239306 RepID=UPI00351F3F6E